MKSSSIVVALFWAQFVYGAGLAGPLTKLISVPDPVPRSLEDRPPGPSPQFPVEVTSDFRPRIAAPRVPLTQSLSRPDFSEKDPDSGSVQKVVRWDDSGKLAGLPGRTARDFLIQVFAPRLTTPDPTVVSPLTLAQCLQKSDHPDRREIVATYWDLSLKLLVDQFAQEEFEQISDMKVIRDTAGVVEFEAMKSESATRRNQASVEFLQSQHRLAGLLGGRRQQVGHHPPLPLPLDLPVVGPYQTNFDRIFQNKPPARRLVEINEMLRPMQNVIESRVRSVQAAERWFGKVQQEVANGEVDISNLMDACKGWHRQKARLVSNIMEYNRLITDYAFSVAPPHVSDIQIVRMLVPLRPDWVQLATRRTDNVSTTQYKQGLNTVPDGGLRKVPPDMKIDLQPVPVE